MGMTVSFLGEHPETGRKRCPATIRQAFRVVIATLRAVRRIHLGASSRATPIGQHRGQVLSMPNDRGLCCDSRRLLQASGMSDATAATTATSDAVWQQLQDAGPEGH